MGEEDAPSGDSPKRHLFPKKDLAQLLFLVICPHPSFQIPSPPPCRSQVPLQHDSPSHTRGNGLATLWVGTLPTWTHPVPSLAPGVRSKAFFPPWISPKSGPWLLWAPWNVGPEPGPPQSYLRGLLLEIKSGGTGGKESAGNTGDPGSMPGSGRYPGVRNGYPLQYSCLEHPMDRGAWWATVHGSERVGHDWATAHTAVHQEHPPTLLIFPKDGSTCNSPVVLTDSRRLCPAEARCVHLGTTSQILTECEGKWDTAVTTRLPHSDSNVSTPLIHLRRLSGGGGEIPGGVRDRQ